MFELQCILTEADGSSSIVSLSSSSCRFRCGGIQINISQCHRREGSRSPRNVITLQVAWLSVIIRSKLVSYIALFCLFWCSKYTSEIVLIVFGFAIFLLLLGQLKLPQRLFWLSLPLLLLGQFSKSQPYDVSGQYFRWCFSIHVRFFIPLEHWWRICFVMSVGGSCTYRSVFASHLQNQVQGIIHKRKLP